MVTSLLADIRRYAKLFLFPLITVTIVVLTYLTAMHSPTPKDVDIAIAGPSEMVTPLIEGLQAGVGDMYTISALPDANAAREAVENRDVAAALVLTAAPDDRTVGENYWNAPTLPESMQAQSAVIYIATGGGSALAMGGLTPLQSTAAQMGMPVMVRDLVPLDKHDRGGNGAMWFTMAVTLCAYVAVTMLVSIAKDLLNLRRLLVALPIYGALMGLLTSGLLAFVFDSLDPAKLPLLVITSALNVTAVGLGAAAIARVLGVFATPVVMFIFMGIGMASSGAAIPEQFVPSFFQFFNPIMPYGATSRSVRDIIYFDNAGLGQNWLLLATWIVAMIVVNAMLNRWRPLPTGNPVEIVSEVPGHTVQAAPAGI